MTREPCQPLLALLLAVACGGADSGAGSADSTGAAARVADSAAATTGASARTTASVCPTLHRAGPLPSALREASGIAISRRHEGLLWLHNDSDAAAVVYAADTTGALLATVRIDGAELNDWEDIAVGDCPAGHCLYIAAIGDNYHERTDRGFYRVPEPDRTARRTARAEFFPFRYPDGPRDAEALYVLPGGDVYVISKGREGPVTVYHFGVPGSPGSARVLEPVQQLTEGMVQLPEMVTAAGATPDGRWLALRTYSALRLYAVRDGRLEPALDPAGVDLTPLGEFQGEGADIRDDGTIYLASEKGLDENPPPPLSVLMCDLHRLASEHPTKSP